LDFRQFGKQMSEFPIKVVRRGDYLRDDDPAFVRHQLQMSTHYYAPYYVDRCGGIIDNQGDEHLPATASNWGLLDFFLTDQLADEHNSE
jgi:hypothetical protein